MKRIGAHVPGRWALTFLFPAILLAAAFGLRAAPFAETIAFTQPDGTTINLWGQGDEFYANFETLDGYTVVFDQALKAYCFAMLSVDGTQLRSTGVPADQGNPQELGLKPHLRLGPEAVRRQVRERYARWDAGMQVSRRWSQLKAARRAAESGLLNSPPPFTTTGTKVGLCLLIDFDDDPATVPQAEIINFCNADNYTSYGNNGSVRKYFQDNSNGLLDYQNVVTIYIRIPNSLHPKSYYNDTSQDCGSQGNLLIRDALDVMKALPNYVSDILPTFDSVNVDENNQVVACNVFYAGGNGGVWSMGLWPHSWALYEVGPQELAPGGKQIWRYQISNIGSSLQLGTFCHENGHLLCGYPDIYDYDADSRGGAGVFCLMDYGNFGINPVQICAYLKRASGWATTTELTSSSSLLATVTATAGANFNHFYRYGKPGILTEYFLMECRHQSGRDTYLPASGVAIWHIDELGDGNNQSLTPNTTHANYEVTLVQADNLWHFEHNVNSGDNYDLYHSGNTISGYSNTFNDASLPAAHWWDGSVSGANFQAFSARAATMTFYVGEVTIPPTILTQPTNQTVGAGGTATFTVAAASPTPLHYQWRFNADDLSGATNTTLPLTGALFSQAGLYSVLVSNQYGSVTSSNATLVVLPQPVHFAAPAVISVPDHGLASPYPSTNWVSAVTGQVLKVTVTLSNLNHTYPSDLEMLLVGPQGQSVVLMSHAGAYWGLENATLTFDDDAGSLLPAGAEITPGSYRPTDYPPGDTFPGAPDPPYGATLAAFKGVNPNGPWRLFVLDDSPLDSGNIANGWALHLFATPPPPVLLQPYVGAGQIHLPVATSLGLIYRLQYKDSLANPDWQTLQTLTGNGTIQAFQDSVPTSGRRFYRLKAE